MSLESRGQSENPIIAQNQVYLAKFGLLYCRFMPKECYCTVQEHASTMQTLILPGLLQELYHLLTTQ